MAEVECILRSGDHFGESPVWSTKEQALYWVDVTAPAVHRFGPTSGEFRTWPMVEAIGCIGLRGSGGLVAGMRSGIYGLDLETGTRQRLAGAEDCGRPVRFNDGKCDRAGRFWSGTLDDVDFAPVGALYRLGRDHRCHKLDEGFVLINGIAWSPDSATMYIADSRREVVWRYDYSLDDGTIANRRRFISTEGLPGRVDGATVAADGTYWCAHVRGGQVAQYDPDGRLIQAIRLPVKFPLMCSFGGSNMDILYVTTSAAMVAPDEIGQQSLAGALFAIHGSGSRGIPEPCYGG